MRSSFVGFGLFALVAPVALLGLACSADDASSSLDAGSVVAEAAADCAPLPTEVTYACAPIEGGPNGAVTCSGISSGQTANQYPFGCTAVLTTPIAGQDQNGCTSPLMCTCQSAPGSEAGAAFVCPN